MSDMIMTADEVKIILIAVMGAIMCVVGFWATSINLIILATSTINFVTITGFMLLCIALGCSIGMEKEDEKLFVKKARVINLKGLTGAELDDLIYEFLETLEAIENE